VGLTAKELTEALKTYNRSNGIEFIYSQDVPRKCLAIGRQAATTAGFYHHHDQASGKERRGTRPRSRISDRLEVSALHPLRPVSTRPIADIESP
jgi:hypothetical protein